MKISELIEKAKCIFENHGDVEVAMVADTDIEPAFEFILEVDEKNTEKVLGAVLLDKATYLENLERISAEGQHAVD